MKHIITIIILLTSITISAQHTAKKEITPIMGIGIIGGANASHFAYSNTNFENYDKDLLLNPQFGICAEIYFGKMISVRPSFLFAGRGEKITSSGINYLLSSKNFDLSLPVMLTFSPDNKFRPFFYLAPVYENTSGGIIGIEDITTDITAANHSKSSLGITPGLGFKLFINDKMYFVIEGGYHIGMSNTYSDSELSGEANALNTADYEIEGSRKNRAPELMASIMFVINKVEEQVIIDIIEPDKEPDKVVVTDEPKDTTTVIEDKDNYTIEEIEKYIHEGVDVTNRKISFDNIEFEFNKSDLTEGSKPILNEIVEFMKKNPDVHIQINGHTDNIGSPEINLKLSNGRAKAVYDYIKSTGIKGNRLTYKGFGDTKPIKPNETEEGRAKNRRVEFQIISH